MNQDAAKQAAGEAAAAMAQDGQRVGLGTGSTTAFAIAALGRRVREDGLQIVGTPTSFAAERLAWLHVDAAYAGSAFICPEFRYLMTGIEVRRPQ